MPIIAYSKGKDKLACCEMLFLDTTYFNSIIPVRMNLVFVDESGDPGLKISQGSSRYFVVALVLFEDNDEAEATDKRIDLLRREMRLNPDYEFRFNKCSKDIRERFLQAVAPYEFFYYGIVINKDPNKLWGEGFRYKGSFYKYTCSLVFENAKAFLDNATVLIDGSGSRDFRKQLEWYFKRRINDPQQRFIRKIKIQDSSNNNLLQLADMIVGAVNRSFGDKSDAQHYRSIISHREVFVQLWPK